MHYTQSKIKLQIIIQKKPSHVSAVLLNKGGLLTISTDARRRTVPDAPCVEIPTARTAPRFVRQGAQCVNCNISLCQKYNYCDRETKLCSELPDGWTVQTQPATGKTCRDARFGTIGTKRPRSRSGNGQTQCVQGNQAAYLPYRGQEQNVTMTFCRQFDTLCQE